MKNLIVFYSLEGNTKFIAELIKESTSADVLELKSKKEIPKKGFLKFIWGGKSILFKEKPTLTNERKNIENYENIFIGTPIWSGTFAPAINTFLTDGKIESKKIAIFSCHSGGGDKKCFAHFTKRLGVDNEIIGKIDFIDPLKAKADEIKIAVNNWIKELTGLGIII